MRYQIEDTFILGYITVALFSSTDDKDVPLDTNYSAQDLSQGAYDMMVRDCKLFQLAALDLIEEDNFSFDKTCDHGVFQQAGHDFWLTRNGHGAGFWDGDWAEPAGIELDKLSKSFGETDLYVGDDKKLHFSR